MKHLYSRHKFSQLSRITAYRMSYMKLTPGWAIITLGGAPSPFLSAYAYGLVDSVVTGSLNRTHLQLEAQLNHSIDIIDITIHGICASQSAAAIAFIHYV